MTRRRMVTIGAVIALAALVWWIADRTYWDEVKVPMPLKGEAAVNPFYAAQRFSERLGARTSWAQTLELPDTDGVIVLSSWHWSLSAPRRERLERWVEAGGRLVVDYSLVGDD